MADIYDQEYISRKMAETMICNACGQIVPPDLQNWQWRKLKNGDRKWTRRGGQCKPCISRKSAKQQYQKQNASEEARLQRNAKSREYKKLYYSNPIKRLKRLFTEKAADDSYFRILCDFAYRELGPKEKIDTDIVSVLKKEIRRRLKDPTTPDIQVAAYYAAEGRPWANPRISEAEAWRLQYKMDKEFQNKEKVRSKIRKELEGRADKGNPAVARRNKRQKLQADNTLTRSRLGKMLKDNRSCLYCGKRLNDTQKAFDHMDPIAKGGEHSITNIAVSCKRCNNRKAAKDFFYWLQEIEPEYAENALTYYESQKRQNVQAVLAFNIF